MSQSGETADVRESLRMVKEKGCLTFGIVNVVGSTIARMTDMGLYTHHDGALSRTQERSPGQGCS